MTQDPKITVALPSSTFDKSCSFMVHGPLPTPTCYLTIHHVDQASVDTKTRPEHHSPEVWGNPYRCTTVLLTIFSGHLAVADSLNSLKHILPTWPTCNNVPTPASDCSGASCLRTRSAAGSSESVSMGAVCNALLGRSDYAGGEWIFPQWMLRSPLTTRPIDCHDCCS